MARATHESSLGRRAKSIRETYGTWKRSESPEKSASPQSEHHALQNVGLLLIAALLIMSHPAARLSGDQDAKRYQAYLDQIKQCDLEKALDDQALCHLAVEIEKFIKLEREKGTDGLLRVDFLVKAKDSKVAQSTLEYVYLSDPTPNLALLERYIEQLKALRNSPDDELVYGNIYHLKYYANQHTSYGTKDITVTSQVTVATGRPSLLITEPNTLWKTHALQFTADPKNPAYSDQDEFSIMVSPQEGDHQNGVWIHMHWQNSQFAAWVRANPQERSRASNIFLGYLDLDAQQLAYAALMRANTK